MTSQQSLLVVDSPGWSDPKGQKQDEKHFTSVIHFLRESEGINAFLILFPAQERFVFEFPN